MISHLSKRVIFTDIDGVCLNWADPFKEYMAENGYISKSNQKKYNIEEDYKITRDEALEMIVRFNASKQASNLPPVHDSLKYMKKIHDDFGFKFQGVTAMGTSQACVDNRMKNLEMFGDIFEGVEFFEAHECKSSYLGNEPIFDSGAFWIEDHPKNAKIGLDCGLTTVLMTNPWNHDFEHDDIERVFSWRDVYESLNSNV